jgi:hypothetical protein
MLRKGKIAVNALIAAVLITNVLLMPVVYAYENPIYSYKLKKSVSYSGINAYTAATVGRFNATYIPSRNAYEYNYRITGVGETRSSSGGSTAACRVQAVEIIELENKANQAMWTSTDSQYIGAWPRPDGNSAYYANVAYTISSIAISYINSYANFAISAATLVSSLLSGCDEQRDGETIWRKWEYDPDKTDVGHFFWWLNDIKPGQTVKFSVGDYLFGPSYEIVGVKWTFTVTAPSRAPSKMTDAEKEKYGIEVIPLNQLKARSSELNLSSETVEDLIECGKPVYVAHKLPVEVVSEEPVDKEEVISKLMEGSKYTRKELFGPLNPFGNKTNKSEESLS